MYAHLLSRGTNSIVDNIVVQMSLNTNSNVVSADFSGVMC